MAGDEADERVADGEVERANAEGDEWQRGGWPVFSHGAVVLFVARKMDCFAAPVLATHRAIGGLRRCNPPYFQDCQMALPRLNHPL